MSYVTYEVEYTDSFGGEANYSWVKRASISVPELPHYGYDGAKGYAKASKAQERQIMRKAKASVGLTGARGRKEYHGETIAFYPYRSCTVMFVSFQY